MALKNTRQCRIQTLTYAGAPVIQTLRKGASVWSKNKGGGTGPQSPPLDPPLQENLLVQ